MTTDSTGHAIDAERPYLLMFLGAVGALGCAALVGGTLAAQMLVPDYYWVSDTLSDLGAGRHDKVMDVSFYGFAAALFAMALAAAHAHLGGIGWSAGVICLAVLAVLVVVVGARNEYGDGDAEGIVIHVYLVYGLGVFFTLSPLLLSSGVGTRHPHARKALLGLGGAWAVLAPFFFVMPDWIDGLYERLLGAIAVAIVLLLSWLFFSRGLRAHRSVEPGPRAAAAHGSVR